VTADSGIVSIMAIFQQACLRLAVKHQESRANTAVVSIQSGGDCGRGALRSIALAAYARNSRPASAVALCGTCNERTHVPDTSLYPTSPRISPMRAKTSVLSKVVVRGKPTHCRLPVMQRANAKIVLPSNSNPDPAMRLASVCGVRA
jgi:hypothetical protein